MSYPFGVKPWRKYTSLAAVLLLSTVPPFVATAWAHAGHGHGEEVGDYDLDAPRIVSAETAKHIGLKVGELESRPLAEIITIGGIVKPTPDRHQTVATRVSGRIVTLDKRVGDRVVKGDLLARIESPEFAKNLYEVRKLEGDYQRLLLERDRASSDVERFSADTESVTAKVTFAQSEVARARVLQGQGMSARELASREADLAQAQAEVRRVRASAALAEKDVVGLGRQVDALSLSRGALLAMNNLDPGTPVGAELTASLDITAQINGVIVERPIDAGSWVQAGQELFSIADFSTVQIEGEVPESLIQRVESAAGNEVRIALPSDPTYVAHGTVRYLAPALDPAKRTAHLIIDVPNADGRLRAEQWVDANVVVKQVKEGWAIPRSAVVVDGPMHFVFIKNGDSYKKQDINPGIGDDEFVEVLDGLAPGDEVVIQGSYSLTQLRPKPGAKKPATPEAPRATGAKP